MRNIIVAGTGPDIGKTVVSAILVQALKRNYWKPLQSGNLDYTDMQMVKSLVEEHSNEWIPERYRLKAPLSPHHSARLEGIHVMREKFDLPISKRALVIECAGGLLVPFNEDALQADIFASWGCDWFLVSKHYLGSINHTLLSIEALQRRNLPLRGIIFNGVQNLDSERAILKRAPVDFIGRLNQESEINPQIVRTYADLWRNDLHTSCT